MIYRSRGRLLKLISLLIAVLSLIRTSGCLQDPGDIETSSDEPTISKSIYADFDVSEEDEDDSNKFSWRYHQEDHGVYAHRSLMSTANIRPQEEADKEETSRRSSTNEDESNPLKTIDFAEKEWQLMFRALDLTFDGVSGGGLPQIGTAANIFEDVVSRLKPECKRDIYHIRDSIKKHKLWALRMVDSNGKIPSGITYGKFSSPGDYEECLSVRVDEKIYSSANPASKNDEPMEFKFHGKYCLIDFRLPLPERPKNKLLSIHDPVVDLSNTELGKQFPDLKNYSGYASVFYEAGYMHGVCLPSSCEVADLIKSLGFALEGLHIIVNNTVDCEERLDGPIPLRTSQVISLTLLGLLFLNVTGATLAHHYQSKDRKRKLREQVHMSSTEREKLAEIDRHRKSNRGSNTLVAVVMGVKHNKFYSDCFSIQTNFERLSKPDPRGLTFVHYTRIVAMALTVITHTAGMGTLQAITKPADASNSEQIFRDFIPQMLANAFTSIQIFFFMAGFMLVISTYPSLKRDKGHISFVEYALKRAIRLMPGIAATICINFIWPLFSDGPMLSYFVRAIVVPCETTWWRTLTFLSNFDHVEKMCLRHSYFSASDYQLHVMAFPLLILLYSQPTASLCIAGLLTVGGFVAQVIMVLTKTLLPFMMVDYIDKEAFFNVVHYIHHPVWNHMSAFFFGFIMGYMVVKQIRVDISDRTIKKVWLVIIPLGVASIFAPYFWNHYKRPIYKWQMVIYVIVDRFILLTTCAWLSYASMVLARPKPKPKQDPALEQPHLNLPDIVTIQSQQDKAKHQHKSLKLSESHHEATQPSAPPTIVTSSMDVERPILTLPDTQSTIPRQRSTPNIQLLSTKDVDTIAGLRSSMSSDDVGGEASRQGNEPEKAETRVQQRVESTGKSRAPVSNVNTLCLILSRLTFQLYLFNMVVLWIDVNHSKYLWYFSYYFIITKALAVYICSSIMAMIFFVTLESPCLTLYIAWVKSRAQARAHGRSTADSRSSGQKQASIATNSDRRINQSGERTVQSPTSRQSPDGSFDGLCMRMSPDTKASMGARPTFNYIDISTEKNIHDDQTRL